MKTIKEAIHLSNHKPLRRIGALLFGLCLIGAVVSNAQDRVQRTETCGAYSERRIAFLLGCCGDLELSYSGPRFAAKLSTTERAMLAIAEADKALTEKCLVPASSEYFSIMLDRIGAHLVLSSERFRATDTEGVKTEKAINDAKVAGQLLHNFTQKYPEESVREWSWIATALSRAGEPWTALNFMANLSPNCCDNAARARIRGDLLFKLGVWGEAAVSYSNWMDIEGSKAHCGYETSLANATILNSWGFRVSVPEQPTRQMSATMCAPREESRWTPYARPSQ
jgi:hypothetical protein